MKDALADTQKGQAMSPGTSVSGAARGQGRDPSAQFKDSRPVSAQAKQALASQRKGAREMISPSTKRSSQIGANLAGALASAFIPGTGAFIKQKMLSDMDKTPYWERKKKKLPTLKPDRGNDSPLMMPKDENVDTESSLLPIGKRKITPFKFNFEYREGGLVRGSGKVLKGKIKKARIY